MGLRSQIKQHLNCVVSKGMFTLMISAMITAEAARSLKGQLREQREIQG